MWLRGGAGAQEHIDSGVRKLGEGFGALRAKLSGARQQAASSYDWLEPLEEEDFRPLQERTAYVPPSAPA